MFYYYPLQEKNLRGTLQNLVRGEGTESPCTTLHLNRWYHLVCTVQRQYLWRTIYKQIIRTCCIYSISNFEGPPRWWVVLLFNCTHINDFGLKGYLSYTWLLFIFRLGCKQFFLKTVAPIRISEMVVEISGYQVISGSKRERDPKGLPPLDFRFVIEILMWLNIPCKNQLNKYGLITWFLGTIYLLSK